MTVLMPEKIGSVLKNGCLSRELIIVDDGSADQIRETVANIIAGNRMGPLYVCQENSDAAEARNRGIGMVSFEYPAFRDSDGLWLAPRLQRQYNLMRERPGEMVCHTREKWLRRGHHLNQEKSICW